MRNGARKRYAVPVLRRTAVSPGREPRGATAGSETSATVLAGVLLEDLVGLRGRVVEGPLRTLLAQDGLVERGGDGRVRRVDPRRRRLVVRIGELGDERLQVRVSLEQRR